MRLNLLCASFTLLFVKEYPCHSHGLVLSHAGRLREIGNFRVPKNLPSKARLSAKPLI